jgi:small subunit ribosomal protein S6
LRRYETIIILMPDLADDQRESMQTRWEGIIDQFKGELIKIEDWGQKRLAYDIKKESRGHYLLFDYAMEDSGLIKELERVLRLDDNVLKYMTVNVSEKVDIEAIRKQELSKREAMEKESLPEQPPVESGLEEELSQEKGEIE